MGYKKAIMFRASGVLLERGFRSFDGITVVTLFSKCDEMSTSIPNLYRFL